MAKKRANPPVRPRTRELTIISQYTAAAKTSTLDPTAKALTTLQALVAKDPKLQGVLSAPSLTPEDKQAIVEELAKQAGAGGETVKNFLGALAENNRLGLLAGVCDKFSVLVSAAKGEVEMTVTSAQVCCSPSMAPARPQAIRLGV